MAYRKRQFWLGIIGCGLLVSLLFGCATLKEATREFAGISTKALEDNRGKAIKKTFNYDYFTCQTKTLGVLKDLGAYVYAKNTSKDLIAFYLSEKDTTPVGLFFTEIDFSHTQIEVSSPSTYAKELIAEKVFLAIESSVSLDKIEEKIK